MSRNYKQARQFHKLKVIQAAELLGVSQPTLSAWEGERKSPYIDSLENMANLYDVTTDYLLGREETAPDPLVPLSPQTLPVLDGKPIWSAAYGWMLVNAIDKLLIRSDGNTISFADSGKLFIMPPPFSEGSYPYKQPLSRTEIEDYAQVWLEPISPDSDLQSELRGWYLVKERFVQNEYGNRFYLDTYGFKWLAFCSEIFEP